MKPFLSKPNNRNVYMCFKWPHSKVWQKACCHTEVRDLMNRTNMDDATHFSDSLTLSSKAFMVLNLVVHTKSETSSKESERERDSFLSAHLANRWCVWKIVGFRKTIQQTLCLSIWGRHFSISVRNAATQTKPLNDSTISYTKINKTS